MSVKKTRKGFWRRTVLVFLVITMTSVGAWFLWRYHGPADPVEIYQGITYGCERLPDTAQSGGLCHWVCVDLKVPGVEFYITPKDPEAVSQGWEYKLKHVSTTVSDNDLAVAVNGTLFKSDSSWIRLPGDLSDGLETVIVDHQVNHVDPNSYLMWWDDNRVAHLERNKPPPEAALRAGKWGIGAQQSALIEGYHAPNSDADQRTIIAANSEKKLVWLFCFDKASYNFASYVVEKHGATMASAVDGGTSMAMAIGKDARHVRTGTVTGNWRPVAVQFGFKALPLKD